MNFLHELVSAKIRQSQAERRAGCSAGLPEDDTDNNFLQSEDSLPGDAENEQDTAEKEVEDTEGIRYIPIIEESERDAYKLEMVKINHHYLLIDG